MDKSDLVGSKKNKGIYSQQLLNLKRKQQVDSIIGDEFESDDNLVKYQDKILCKLCNTLHVNIISYKRHIRGKKHLTKLKLKEKRSAKHDEKFGVESKRESVKSEADIKRENFIKQYTTKLLQKHNIKNKSTPFFNIGQAIPPENILTEYTIDNSSTKEGEDSIGLLIRVKLDGNENKTNFLYKKYLSKEELSTHKIETQNDLLLLHIPEYKPIIIKIPEKMSLLGGEEGMLDCEVDDCWYLQLSLLIRD